MGNGFRAVGDPWGIAEIHPLQYSDGADVKTRSVTCGIDSVTRVAYGVLILADVEGNNPPWSQVWWGM